MADDTFILEHQFKQPFPRDFGLDGDGNPTKPFKDFVNSNLIFDIYVGFRMLIKDLSEYNDVLTHIFKIPKICIAKVTLINYGRYYYTHKEMIMKKYPHIKELTDLKTISFIPYVDMDIIHAIKTDSDRLRKALLNYHQGIYQVNKCHKEGSLYKINIHLITVGSDTSHTFQVIVNPQNNTAYILESSEFKLLARIEEVSVSSYLQLHIDPDIKLEIRNFEECSELRLQGDTSLCSTWNFYLFTLVLLNPGLNQNDIMKIFDKATQDERNFVILQFMYYTYDLIQNIEKGTEAYYHEYMFKDRINEFEDSATIIPRFN